MSFNYSVQYNRYSGINHIASNSAAQRYVDILKPYLPEDKTARILEIGPGNGLTMNALNKLGYMNVTGIEADLSLANAMIKNQQNIEHIDANLISKELNHRPEIYDFIYLMHVLEHVPKDKQIEFVSSLKTTLKKGGIIVCETPNALSPISNYLRYNDWTHVINFTTTSLTFLFENAGLKILIAAGSTPLPTLPRGGKIVSLLKLFIEKILRAVSLLIQRIHYVSEYGFFGFSLPFSQAIYVVAKKD